MFSFGQILFLIAAFIAAAVYYNKWQKQKQGSMMRVDYMMMCVCNASFCFAARDARLLRHLKKTTSLTRRGRFSSRHKLRFFVTIPCMRVILCIIPCMRVILSDTIFVLVARSLLSASHRMDKLPSQRRNVSACGRRRTRRLRRPRPSARRRKRSVNFPDPTDPPMLVCC